MKEPIELAMYPDLRTWIEEISYFFGKEVEDSNANYYNFYYYDDCLLLMEDMYNVEHAHNDIMEALKEACERELFNRGIYGKPVKIQNNLIIFEK